MLAAATVALALDLGVNLIALSNLLLERRANSTDREQIEDFITRHGQFSKACQAIALVLRRYNELLAQAALDKNIGALHPYCTDHGYRSICDLYDAYQRVQLRYQTLDSFELLSVDIKQVRGRTIMQNRDLHEPTGAIAYTREHWTLTYADGGQTEMDVINAYELKWLGGVWKIDTAEVFSKQ